MEAAFLLGALLVLPLLLGLMVKWMIDDRAARLRGELPPTNLRYVGPAKHVCPRCYSGKAERYQARSFTEDTLRSLREDGPWIYRCTGCGRYSPTS